jgi:DNA (cytosine-5)-methyltransferase 1
LEVALNELHLFAGAGGGILGGILLGHRTVCAVEIEPYCRKVLLQRQRDGILPWFPIWDDVRTFDGKPWRGIADVVCGGFPCQDISGANITGKGLDGEHSGLWREMARVVCEVGPDFVYVENSPMLTIRGLGRVLRDLAAMGYDARWGCISASDFGGLHGRKRIWIVAYSEKIRRERSFDGKNESHIKRRFSAQVSTPRDVVGDKERFYEQVRSAEFVRTANGMAGRVDRVAACGNGQFPRVAAGAWEILST